MPSSRHEVTTLLTGLSDGPIIAAASRPFVPPASNYVITSCALSLSESLALSQGAITLNNSSATDSLFDEAQMGTP